MDGAISRSRTVPVAVIFAYGNSHSRRLAFIYLGACDIRLGRFALGSDDQIFETARVRSIKAHATRITPPSELEDEAKILMGIAGVDHDHPADHHH
jgi:hypothetical protein